MRTLSQTFKPLPLDIVGGTNFGRYPKISTEQTFNMMVSDGWLVPFAGYKKVLSIVDGGTGRGIYSSYRFGHLIVVIDNGVYAIDKYLTKSRIGEIDTYSGDVFIDENNASQIAICDKSALYIYNYSNNSFQKVSLDFIPGYIAFQDGYFIAPAVGTNRWRLSQPNDGLHWVADAASVGLIQTKPDYVVAAIRVPGKGKLLFVIGGTVMEAWYNTGAQLFPFQCNSYFDIDLGCLNPATVASNENTVVWLAANEKSGPVIAYTEGGPPQTISNEGLNFKFSQLKNPQNCYGFLFKQDGHLIYQFTFPDDDVSYAYDFNEKLFYTLTNERMGANIAKRVAFFNDSYYFVSFIDGDLYELNSKYTTFDGNEIPRMRTTKNIRTKDSSWFIANNLTFTLEQGSSSSIQRVDLAVSVDGGESQSSFMSEVLNPLGKRQNKLTFWGLGSANDMVFQFRFWGKGRFVATDGVVNIYQ